MVGLLKYLCPFMSSKEKRISFGNQTGSTHAFEGSVLFLQVIVSIYNIDLVPLKPIASDRMGPDEGGHF